VEYLKNLYRAQEAERDLPGSRHAERVGQATDLSEADRSFAGVVTYIADQRTKGVNVTLPDALAHVKSTSRKQESQAPYAHVE